MAGRYPDEALSVLRALSDQPLEGYRLMGRTRLDVETLEKCLSQLEQDHLVSVKRAGEGFGEAIVYVPPSARDEVNMLVGRTSKY